MNIQKSINKLLMALQQMGTYYRINSFKSYSDKTNRNFTSYQLMAGVEVPYFDEEEQKEMIKIKYVKILETYSQVELLKALVDEYNDLLKEGSEADG